MNTLRSLAVSNRYPIALTLLPLVVFWPLVTGTCIPKWDSLDGYLPYRYVVSDFLRHGELPFWHPFTHLGNPTYADLQSGAWSPFVWIASAFGDYGIGALTTELLLCFIIAGLGMYTLVNRLTQSPEIAFAAGATYALSGPMTGSAHLMVFLIGMAWLPLIVHYLLKLLAQPHTQTALKLGLVTALHTVSASPAFTILLVYFLTAFLVWYFAVHRRALPSTPQLRFAALSVAVAAVLCLPYLVAFAEFSPYFNRLAAEPDASYLINPFTPRHYLSFVAPLLSLAADFDFGPGDLTLRNAFFGFWGWMGMLAAPFFLAKTKWVPVLLGSAAVLVFAAGAQTDLYGWLMKLPGIGVIRHPSIYKSYLVFTGTVLAALTLNELFRRGLLPQAIRALALLLSTAGVWCIAWGLSSDGLPQLSETFVGMLHFTEFPAGGAATLAIVNGCILAALSLALFAGTLVVHRKPLVFFAAVVVIEMAGTAYLIAPTTVYNRIERSSIAAFFETLPEQPDPAFNRVPMGQLTENEGMAYTHGLWRNLSVYHKRPAWNGCNPLRFAAFDALIDAGRDSLILSKPLFWLDDSTAHITASEILRNGFSVRIDNPQQRPLKLIVNQNFHRNWRTEVNGVPASIQPVYATVMGIDLPAAERHNVVLAFTSLPVKVAALIAAMGYLVVAILLIRPLYRHQKNRAKRATSSSPIPQG